MAYDFLLAYRGKLSAGAIRPEPPEDGERKLELIVLFTGVANTLKALDTAMCMAEGLNARVRLVVPQTVPYPLPLASPPVLLEFTEDCFRKIAEVQSVETAVEIFLCRDSYTLWQEVLLPHSTVIVGGSKRWWPTKEQRLARRLQKMGHEAIFATAAIPEGKFLHA